MSGPQTIRGKGVIVGVATVGNTCLVQRFTGDNGGFSPAYSMVFFSVMLFLYILRQLDVIF
jgi:hypothetical protein